jgi:hypothetical protein
VTGPAAGQPGSGVAERAARSSSEIGRTRRSSGSRPARSAAIWVVVVLVLITGFIVTIGVRTAVLAARHQPFPERKARWIVGAVRYTFR